jgi:hypothetical protein
VLHSFLVIPLSSVIPCLLGSDLLGHSGISIRGLPSLEPEPQAEAVQDRSPSLFDDVLSFPKLLATIKPDIDASLAIPLDSFCFFIILNLANYGGAN